MNIKENNKLIAEFMGIESFKDSLASLNDGKINISKDVYEQAKYHTSWDWLIPVVEKIKQYCLYKVEDVGSDYKVVFIDNSGYNPSEQKMFMFSDKDYKKATYKAVVEFIKWYNEQNRFICGSCDEHTNEYTYNEDKDIDECNNCKED